MRNGNCAFFGFIETLPLLNCIDEFAIPLKNKFFYSLFFANIKIYDFQEIKYNII